MNKLAILIDITDRSEDIIKKFKSGDYTVPSRVSWIEDVEKNCTGNYEKKVLIWHLSSSRIDNTLFSLPELGKAITLLDRCQFTHKFGVTDNDESYRQQVRATGWFSAVESWAELKDRFSKNIDNGLEEKENLIKATKKHLLHSFLPLDIDMQALADERVTDKKKYLQDMIKDLDELYNSEEYAGKDKKEHYCQKLYDLWYLLGQKEYLEEIGKKASSKVENLTPIDNPLDPLKTLAGLNNADPMESPIYKFLKSLDTCKKDDKNVTVASLCEPFKDWKINDKNIKSFHDWYCALAEYLRGEEGCK